MAKFHYRLPPCPSYDIEGLESWLSDLAETGLMLDKNGYVFGFFQFQRDTPRKAKYRLEANTHMSAVDPKAPEDPDGEALSLSEEFGWDYLGQFRDFFIYRTFDPDAREMNTDPVVQAMALDSVKKRSLFFLIFLVIQMLSVLLGLLGTPAEVDREVLQKSIRWAALIPCAGLGGLLFFGKKVSGKLSETLSRIAVLLFFAYWNVISYVSAGAITPLLDILNKGWLWWVLMAALLLLTFLLALSSCLHLAGLQRRLRRGGTLNREMDWKKGRFLRMLPAFLPYLLLFSLPFAGNYGGRPDNSVPIGEFTREVPFVTIADLAPEREYLPVTRNANNTVRYWSDILSPVNYDWDENAWLDAPDGSRYGGTLSVTYHEAANEDIARRLVVEYAGKKQADASLLPETIDPSQFDFLEIYPSVHPSILIRKGNVVIYAYCSVQSWDEHENLYSVWLELMAAQMRETDDAA